MLNALSGALWQAALWVHHRRPSHTGLAAWGVVILLAGFAMWGLLLWMGWSLIFMADPQAVVASRTGLPANWVERVYYAGFSISTLGVGDFVAGGGVFQVLTVVAATSGFFLLTLSVTYLLSVLPALARKRALANYITALGATPAGIIGEQWRGGNCQRLLDHVPTLMQLMETLAQELAAFPILHYFHASERNAALPLRLAALSETLLCLQSGAVRCPETAAGVRPLHRSLDTVLSTLEELYLGASDEEPPLPDRTAFPDSVEVDGAADLESAAAERQHHRRALLRYVRNEGWLWEEVYRPSADPAVSADPDRAIT